MWIPHNLLGIIIGRRGRNITELQENLKVDIKIDSNKKSTRSQNLLILGPPKNTQKAKATIIEKYRCRNLSRCTRHDCKFLHIEKESNTDKFEDLGKREPFIRKTKMQNHEIQAEMCIPQGLVGIIIGCQGKTIGDLQKNLKVRIKICSEDMGPGIPNLLLVGSPTNIEKAKETIINRYQCRNMLQGCNRNGCKFIHSETVSTLNEKGQPQRLNKSLYLADKEINDKVSLWQGDITSLEIDAIVNAANTSLLGGGGVDGHIHRMAGPSLKDECQLLNGASTGQAKITTGHKLPAKYIIHTVGPRGEKPTKLEECYTNCLRLVEEYGIRTIAFCCISTGAYGYPNEPAACIALNTVRKWMNINRDKVDQIIFCCYLDRDYNIYADLMTNVFFPIQTEATVRI